ncbi:MAG: tRNA N6-adenosine threonylcarbamoyltransferase [Pseudomonadota bacterium]
MDRGQTFLGIETSCDETAAAVVRREADGRGAILANVVRAQWQEHKAFGGVVPELAARAHVLCLDEIIETALAKAGLQFDRLDGIAVTAGPGLIGGLMVGVTTAEAVGLATGLRVVGINHLEGHALTAGLTDGVAPPYLLLLVSGGHSQLVAVHGVGHYERLGSTIDDALGEAFDKTAKLLGLGQPGGPRVEATAKSGDALRFSLPRPMAGRAEPHFSFAGLKTAVRVTAQKLMVAQGGTLSEVDLADLCASFELAVAESVIDRVRCAVRLLNERGQGAVASTLVVAGGVAANQRLRRALEGHAQETGTRFVAPPIALCGDNGAMIAWAAMERIAQGLETIPPRPRARWPLDETASAVLGHGRLGMKA